MYPAAYCSPLYQISYESLGTILKRFIENTAAVAWIQTCSSIGEIPRHKILRLVDIWRKRSSEDCD